VLFRSSGVDIGATPGFVTKEYLIDVYPSLVGTFKQAGLWLWGNNGYGQLGDNSRTNRSSPVQTVSGGTNWKFIACGVQHTSAIKTDGTLWNWGLNTQGQLGDNTIIHKSSPVQTVSGGTNWKQVDCGNYSIAAIKTDGTLWMWGENSFGNLGDNTRTHRSSPVQTVSGGTNWKQVAGGSSHTAAIKTDGTLWTWGNNGFYGALGDNSITHRSSPVQTVSGGTNWKQVASGSGHIAAIKTDGTLWTWGRNSQGQLGDNSTTDRSSPVQTVSGGTNWRQVAGGSFHTAAIKTDGTLWTWGDNSPYGQLGDNSITDRASPVQTVSGGTNWKLVAGGNYHTAAIKTDGTLWTWGYNNLGTLGDNSITHRSSPVQTVSGGTNWKQVAGGAYSTAATRF
jgi:alpha-tubulin suppressor-like RCC1 family protein